MALIKDLSRKQFWVVNGANRMFELPVGSSTLAPNEYGIETWLREGDGNGGVGSGSPSERAELQSSAVGTYGVMQWWRFICKFDQNFVIATNPSWHICPMQWHMYSINGSQPPINFQIIGTTCRLVLRPNGGLGYTNLGTWPADFGKEHEFRLGIEFTQGSGRIILYRDNVKIIDRTETGTTGEGRNPYPKTGVYLSLIHI